MKTSFFSESEYLKYLESQSAFPQGFKAKVLSCAFTPEEEPVKKSGEPNVQNMNIAMVQVDEATDSFAGVFTKNQFPGAPIIIGRSRINEQKIRSLVINNKVSNVCADKGIEASEAICEQVAQEIGCMSFQVIPCSTGVIGRKLPVGSMGKSLIDQENSSWDANGLDVAQAIMTTDRYPKLIKVRIGDGEILGIAKGAGMVEPKMATMLAYIFTDIDIDREDLRRVFKTVVDRTFNRISIDASQSTSDTVLALSSKKISGISLEDFTEGLQEVCGYLSEGIVRNGEGTSHVLEVTVSLAPDEDMATRIARGIVNNPLFKSAIAGNDPNVGRLAGAVGDVLGDLVFVPFDKGDGLEVGIKDRKEGQGVLSTNIQNDRIDTGKVTMHIGSVEVFRNGTFSMNAAKEEQLYQYFKSAEMDPHGKHPVHGENIQIHIDLGQGRAQSTVFGSDLTKEYVEINGDYRT